MKKTLILACVISMVALMVQPVMGQGYLKTDFRLDGNIPSGALYRDLYGAVNPKLNLGFGFNMFNRVEIRLEVSYFQDKGGTSVTDEEIIFKYTSYGGGLRFNLFQVKTQSFYFGLGFKYCTYSEEVPERFSDYSDNGTAVYFELGDYWYLNNTFYLNLNGRYSLLKVAPFKEDIDLGGVQIGVGIGIRY